MFNLCEPIELFFVSLAYIELNGAVLGKIIMDLPRHNF